MRGWRFLPRLCWGRGGAGAAAVLGPLTASVLYTTVSLTDHDKKPSKASFNSTGNLAFYSLYSIPVSELGWMMKLLFPL